MSASLTDTQTWSFFRSLAIKNRLEELAPETTVWPTLTRRSMTTPLMGDRIRVKSRSIFACRSATSACLISASWTPTLASATLQAAASASYWLRAMTLSLINWSSRFKLASARCRLACASLRDASALFDRGLVLIDRRLVQGLVDCGQHGPFLNLRAEVDRLADDVRVGADTLDDAIYLRADIDNFLWFHRSQGMDRRRRVTAAHGTRGARRRGLRPIGRGDDPREPKRGRHRQGNTPRVHACTHRPFSCHESDIYST